MGAAFTELELRRLAEFVDRTHELERFNEMLASTQRNVMIVWGESGTGKTSLRLRMVHECALKSVRKAEVECGAARTSGYMAIMRKVSDDLGLRHFNAFTNYLEFLTNPQYRGKLSIDINVEGGVRVAENATINADVGSISGPVIKDNNFLLPRSDIAVPEEERMLRLSDAFLQGLQLASREGTLVVFLDATEKLARDTRRWLWEELLPAARDDRLPGVKFVLCGHERPQLDRDWRSVVEEAELKPLELEHITMYLGKRGVDASIADPLAVMVLGKTRGKILEIAEMVDAYLALQASRGKR